LKYKTWSTFLWYWDFFVAQGLHLEPLHQHVFCDRFFQDKVLQTVFSDWLWTTVLLISASWVTRTTGMSHQCLAQSIYYWVCFHAEFDSYIQYIPWRFSFPLVLGITLFYCIKYIIWFLIIVGISAILMEDP
jgi:hypothetical protein